MRVWLARFLACAAVAPLAGCGLGPTLFGGGPNRSVGETNAPPSVFGYVAADEPQAALVARQVLYQGGNAADAAVAAGFAMSVTLPSRAGLGGGGACLVKVPDAQGKARPAAMLLFAPAAPASAAGARPAAVPAMARGLLALEARYGILPFSSVIAPAERLAGGVPVSPALESDLQVVGTALLADPAAAAVFGPGGTILPAGADLSQPDLAQSFEVLRTQGVQGFYSGGFAGQFAAAAGQAGAAITPQDLAASVPRFSAPVLSAAGGSQIASLPESGTPGRALPASAAFAVLDKQGGIVACAVTMNNLFGTGRIAPDTGILLAASPRTSAVPMLAAAIAYQPDSGAFRAAVTGTGQEGAALAAQDGMANALGKTPAAEVPEPGRANVISCPGLVPGGEASCTASADARGQGLAIGGR